MEKIRTRTWDIYLYLFLWVKKKLKEWRAFQKFYRQFNAYFFAIKISNYKNIGDNNNNNDNIKLIDIWKTGVDEKYFSFISQLYLLSTTP